MSSDEKFKDSYEELKRIIETRSFTAIYISSHFNIDFAKDPKDFLEFKYYDVTIAPLNKILYVFEENFKKIFENEEDFSDLYFYNCNKKVSYRNSYIINMKRLKRIVSIKKGKYADSVTRIFMDFKKMGTFSVDLSQKELDRFFEKVKEFLTPEEYLRILLLNQ